MSGGVDSSVAAALLVEQGYDVIGITMKTHSFEDFGGNVHNESSCCSLDGINDARRVCGQLGIPHYVLDFSGAFLESVVNPFVEGYIGGTTPNPCVLCNRRIKWEHLIRKARSLGAELVAMGHYARVVSGSKGSRHWIQRGADEGKDQSYALWALSQDSLRRTLFPLGNMRKEEARAHARRFDLHTAAKGESFEICFIPDNDYGRFLRDRIDGLDASVRGGDIVFERQVIGTHDGYPFYTIGQRRGLNIAIGEPLYVTSIDAASNTVHVGRESDLYSKGCVVRDIVMQKHTYPDSEIRITARIRYRDPGAPAMLRPASEGRLIVEFDEKRRAITPGQSVVFYDGDDVVGGGIINSVIAKEHDAE